MPVASAERICARCGHVGFAQWERRGSPLLGSLLWFGTMVLFFASAAAWVLGLLALAALLVAMGYSMWRFAGSIRVCGQCGAPDPVTLRTPEGRQLLEKHQVARRRGHR